MTTNDLTQAVATVDLPALIADYFPESGAQPNRGGAFKAVWRGESNPSGSLFKSSTGAWLLHDHGQDETHNAFDFLTTVMGMSKAEAAEELKRRAGMGTESKRPPALKPKSEIVASSTSISYWDR